MRNLARTPRREQSVDLYSESVKLVASEEKEEKKREEKQIIEKTCNKSVPCLQSSRALAKEETLKRNIVQNIQFI